MNKQNEMPEALRVLKYCFSIAKRKQGEARDFARRFDCSTSHGGANAFEIMAVIVKEQIEIIQGAQLIHHNGKDYYPDKEG